MCDDDDGRVCDAYRPGVDSGKKRLAASRRVSVQRSRQETVSNISTETVSNRNTNQSTGRPQPARCSKEPVQSHAVTNYRQE